MSFRTRFAPSPTGPLHLGHAYSALLAYDTAQACGGECLLRIEDIDQSRARAEWEAQIFDDLHWLGLSWPEPVLRQSSRTEAYEDALSTLWQRGLLYPCSCKRRDIEAALSAPQEGALQYGPDGLIYPGTCRGKRSPQDTTPPRNVALRLDMAKAMALFHEPPSFSETGGGLQNETGKIAISPNEAVQKIGDIVLARRDMGTSYHLSVVLDDAYQGVTDVIRGEDLFEATKIHVILQKLLDLPTPTYHHHRLIRDDNGKRLAKRDDARALSKYRAEGHTPKDIREMVGL